VTYRNRFQERRGRQNHSVRRHLRGGAMPGDPRCGGRAGRGGMV